MKYIAILFLTICGLLVIPSSCTKESQINLNIDSATISKIYQPDEILSKDAVIESLHPDLNYGNIPYLSAFSWTSSGSLNNSRFLIEFDLTNIPPHTKIKNAKLSLFWSSHENLAEQTGDNAFTIFKVTEKWDEETVTWNNQPVFSEVNSIKILKSLSANQSYTDLDVSNLVQEIIDSPSDNHGFMIKLNEEFPYRLLILASSNHAEPDKRPKLVIEF